MLIVGIPRRRGEATVALYRAFRSRGESAAVGTELRRGAGSIHHRRRRGARRGHGGLERRRAQMAGDGDFDREGREGTEVRNHEGIKITKKHEGGWCRVGLAPRPRIPWACGFLHPPALRATPFKGGHSSAPFAGSPFSSMSTSSTESTKSFWSFRSFQKSKCSFAVGWGSPHAMRSATSRTSAFPSATWERAGGEGNGQWGGTGGGDGGGAGRGGLSRVGRGGRRGCVRARSQCAAGCGRGAPLWGRGRGGAAGRHTSRPGGPSPAV
jgi:hypothetical protein